MLLNEALNLHRRPAAHVQHLERSACRLGLRSEVAQILHKNVDAIAVRLSHVGAQKSGVDDLEVGVRTFTRVGEDLVDHFIIARITKRLCVRAIDERRAQQQRMQRRLRERAVCRSELGLDLARFRL